MIQGAGTRYQHRSQATIRFNLKCQTPSPLGVHVPTHLSALIL